MTAFFARCLEFGVGASRRNACSASIGVAALETRIRDGTTVRRKSTGTLLNAPTSASRRFRVRSEVDRADHLLESRIHTVEPTEFGV